MRSCGWALDSSQVHHSNPMDQTCFPYLVCFPSLQLSVCHFRKIRVNFSSNVYYRYREWIEKQLITTAVCTVANVRHTVIVLIFDCMLANKIHTIPKTIHTIIYNTRNLRVKYCASTWSCLRLIQNPPIPFFSSN